MSLTLVNKSSFLNDWLNQMNEKVTYVNDKALVSSLKYIEEHGIPDLKSESYKYLNIESTIKRNFRSLTSAPASTVNSQVLEQYANKNFFTILLHGKNILHDIKTDTVTIYNNPQKLPTNLSGYLNQSNLHQKDFFAALNTAYCSDILIIHITKTPEKPIQIVHSFEHQKNNFHQQRILVVTEQKVQATIYEKFICNNNHSVLSNLFTEVHADKYSTINWISCQNDLSNNLFCFNNFAVNAQHSTNINHHLVSLHGNLWKNNLHFFLQDEQIKCSLNGLAYAKNQTIISNNTSIYHQKPNSESHQQYKNIADDKSTIVFNGFILVEQYAQKTNAYQNSKNILLSENASVYAKPQLEIYADDVKCSHGSSTGYLNQDALFYLQSRGISQSEAQKLLINAFCNEVVSTLNNETIVSEIESLLTNY